MDKKKEERGINKVLRERKTNTATNTKPWLGSLSQGAYTVLQSTLMGHDTRQLCTWKVLMNMEYTFLLPTWYISKMCH